MKSNYVCAGYETLAQILHNFVTNKTKRYENNFTHECINNFFSQSCNMFLHSFGQNFTGKKKFDKHVENEANMYRKTREWGFFDNSLFLADSGGFQASIGSIKKYETDILIKLYHQFLEEYHDVYDRAFILDLPPGPGCKLFETFDDVYEKNLETYMMAANMPQHVRDKIIYIHHFRTPKLWDIYTRILRENNLFDKFKYHATGGIIANMASDAQIPCIIYVIPMIPLLNECKRFKRKELKFHILGGANFRDILFYEIFRLHILKEHDIEVEITYDSSGLFKGLMMARYITVLDNGLLRKLDLRTQNLHLRFLNEEKRIDRYQRAISELSNKYNFKDVSRPDIYNPETGTFYDELRVYSMLYMLNQFAEVQTLAREKAAEIYPLYESRNNEEFTKNVEIIIKNLNGGKITRKQKSKSVSVVNSLKMLSNLDEEYCKYIVNKVLAKDEFTELDNSKRVLTF